jgi:lysophospholipase L1-like esterase
VRALAGRFRIARGGQRSGWRTPLLALLLALACGRLAYRLWEIHSQDWKPLPGDVSTAGPCTVWFVGSSSFSYWDRLGPDMQPWQAVNRGVPGADIPRLLSRWHRQGHFAPPPAIVVYAGENDIDRGRDAGRVARDYAGLLQALTTAMPDTPIIAMAIKPSPKRWTERADQLRLNQQILELAKKNPSIHYLDANGQFMPGGLFGPYYWDDGLHLNGGGHAIWAKLIKGELVRYVPGGRRQCGA